MGALASLRYGLRRLKIRRLYNHSKFRESIRFAEAQLNCPINGQFAKDIIIRALWNLEEWSLAIDFVMQHPQIDTSNYLQRAKYKLNQGHLEILPPAELRSTEWNGVELLQNWYPGWNGFVVALSKWMASLGNADRVRLVLHTSEFTCFSNGDCPLSNGVRNGPY